MKWLIVCSVFLYSFCTYAALDYGLELGTRQQQATFLPADLTGNAQWGWQFGGFAHLPMDEKGMLHGRTGLFFTQRPLESESESTGEKNRYTFNYLDVPFDLLFQVAEKFAIYFGFDVSINIASDCDLAGCKVNGVQTPITPGHLGFLFKFTPKFGFNFYMESYYGQISKGIQDSNAVGLNLTYSLN
ncbi:hypothetical protein [Bdellovibrio sp. HCB2-146]|uniref:hypothetical protein n=1 Tax=Bdellovibrio sp. HCB2-146 TaxID=3394362 RepID=UPI0039BC69AF